MGNRIGCIGWAIIIFLVLIFIDYWPVILGVGIVAAIIYGIYRQQTAPKRKQERADNEAARTKKIDFWKTCNLSSVIMTTPDIILKAGENEFFKSAGSVDWKEQRVHTERINYSGVTSRVKIMKGVYWRAGSIKPMSEKTTTMDTIHSGQIILTNKRLLVMDENGSTAQVMYSNITNVIPYSDALGIMKSRGKDVYLIGNIDYEEVAIILIRLMTNDLAAHRKIAENVSEREPDSTAKDTSNLIDEKTSIDPKRKLTPHDLLTFIKIIDPKVDLRLDKNQHFFYDNSDELTLQDLKEAFTSAPTDAMNQLQPILSHSLKLSKTLAQKLGNTDYVFRYYFGKNFDTLICQCRDGKIEYYILNDPKFLNS